MANDAAIAGPKYSAAFHEAMVDSLVRVVDPSTMEDEEDGIQMLLPEKAERNSIKVS